MKAAKIGLIKVFFADGVHLTYGYQGGYSWSKKRQTVPSAYGRKRANLLGFMDSVTYETIKEMDIDKKYLNADSVCNGLKKLREKFPEEVLYVIMDNAAYQRCKKVAQAAEELKINLVFLPPYSPNLNLIERLWKFLRKHILANQFYHSFKEFFDAIAHFVDTLHTSHSKQLSSLMTFHFEVLNSPLDNQY